MTCFGTVLSDETSVGHAWTIYRRESDDEWVPLEWTDSSTRSVTSVDAITRMVDLTSTYTAVSYLLTSTAFSSITTATWLLRITTLTADGACMAPLPTVTGQTNLVGKVALGIPKLAADIRAGLRQNLALPTWSNTATARLASRSTSFCTLPPPVVATKTGALGKCSQPPMHASGATGASGSVWLHPLTTDTSAKARAFVDATLIAPRPRASGHALVGAVVMPLPLGGCQ